MKVGLNLSNMDTVVTDARNAEDVGFDYIGAGEHLFFHTATPNSFVQLAAAAGATSRIRLVSAVTLLPLYPAPLVAKLAASLDRVSGGRFELGIGSGGEYPAEFAAVGVPIDERFRRVTEGLHVIEQLFTGEKITFDGEFTRLTEVALQPPPHQRGGPPLWLGGRKDGAIRRAGRFADVWMPYMVDPQMMSTTLTQVRRHATEHGRSAEEVKGAVLAWTCVDDDRNWAHRTGLTAVSANYRQDFTKLADKYLLLGTPDDVVARLREFADAGTETVLLQIAAGSENSQRVIRTIAEQVLPHLGPLH